MNFDMLKLTIQDLGTRFGIQLLSALAIYIGGKIAMSVISSAVSKILTKRKVDETVSNFVVHLVRIGLTVFIFIAVLAQLGIQTASVIAILGAASFAVGLALQGALANFAAGVLLMLFRPFKVGDVVSVAGQTGKVTAISVL
ncbi:mechanosensitive ion channel, partial [Myxococcota bacterium]|nr:mechanosensitive ion channel [Myxococcota bacterium]